jgi:hypothetical protein
MDYEKEPIIFDETPNKNDRSFDSGNTYQKPSNNLYLTQTNGGRSTTNIVYTKKGMRGRSSEKFNNSNNMSNNINQKNNYYNNNSNYNYVNNQNKNYNNRYNNNYDYFNGNNYVLQDMSNSYGTNTNNINNIYLNSINGGLNSSYQDFGYRKPTQIYCKSPTRYRKTTTTFGSPKLTYNNVNKNNPYDYFENNRISNASLTGMNSMTNIHNYTNMANKNSSLTYNNNYHNFYNPQSINNSSINLEDLMILEEKLSEIIKSLNGNKVIYNECFEWWNYYYNCSLYGTIEKVFKGEDSGIVQSSINYELLTIMICYDISYDQNNLSEVLIMVNAVLNLNHKNLLIICEYILSKISNDSLGNTWVYKLKNLVSTSKNKSEDNDYISYN